MAFTSDSGCANRGKERYLEHVVRSPHSCQASRGRPHELWFGKWLRSWRKGEKAGESASTGGDRQSQPRQPHASSPQRNRLESHNSGQVEALPPEHKTVVPEVRIGYGRRHNALRDMILCADQNESMAASVVYSGGFGAVLASIAAVRTRMEYFFGCFSSRGCIRAAEVRGSLSSTP